MNLYKEEQVFYANENWNRDLLISLKNIFHIYKDESVEVVALRDFSLDIKKGEILGIMGPSGSGKTTLIKILSGLLKPSSGCIFYQQLDTKIIDLTTKSEDELTNFRRDELGIITQHFSLFPYLNAYQNIEIPFLIKEDGQKKSKIKNKLSVSLPNQLVKENEKNHQDIIEQMLEIVDMKKRKFHLINKMSGGEKQRVAICAALAKDPRLILADEPTGELDHSNTIKILDLFKKISKTMSKTIIIVSHNQLIREYCDRVIDLVDGQIAQIYVNNLKNNKN